MIDHRVARERTELRCRPMRQGLRLTALKAFDVRRRKCLHVVEMTEKIAAPETAPVFAVGHHFQSERRFPGNSAADRLVLDCFQIGCADLARITFGARLFDFLWSQQAADMIGAERWFGYHRLASVFLVLLFVA